MKTKKISYNDLEFVRTLIQKELDIHGAKFEDIQALPEGMLPDGSFWFHFYTFDTPEQYQEWKDFSINQLRNTREKLSKKMAEKVFDMFDLTYGLRRNYKV